MALVYTEGLGLQMQVLTSEMQSRGSVPGIKMNLHVSAYADAGQNLNE
jgi:hypothetical protein